MPSGAGGSGGANVCTGITGGGGAIGRTEGGAEGIIGRTDAGAGATGRNDAGADGIEDPEIGCCDGRNEPPVTTASGFGVRSAASFAEGRSDAGGGGIVGAG